MAKPPTSPFPKASLKNKDEKYVLRLYITGNTPRSITAILNLKEICEEHLKNRYELEVIDILQDPTQAKCEQIIASPTLVKISPLPLRRLIGDLSNESKVLTGLDIRTLKKETPKAGTNAI